MASRRPKVLSISRPSWAGEEYLKEFESEFDLHVSLRRAASRTMLMECLSNMQVVTPGDRQTTIKNLADKVREEGPFDAALILFGIVLYEPFDEELLGPLVPHCRVIGSASAGYNEFDVEWMSKNGILFCNSRNAVNEASADMALFMMLGVLKDIQRLQASIKNGTWRGQVPGPLAPTRDPAGVTLGIIGMGAIGKVGHCVHRSL